MSRTDVFGHHRFILGKSINGNKIRQRLSIRQIQAGVQSDRCATDQQ
jgi:hypothetical protein